MRKSFAAIAALVLCGLSGAISARDNPFVIDNSHRVALNSELTGRQHELVILLPASYHDKPDKHYPVLYFVDAYWDTPLLSAIHGNLVWDTLLPELILVGFSYAGDSPNVSELRERDFTPTRDESTNAHSGEAPQFLRFIEQSVIAFVDDNYRTLDDERALSGNSYGGLFTLYALYEKPELFGRFIAISPAVIWDDGYLFRRDGAHAKSGQALPARLYLSQGGDEYSPFRDPIVEFQSTLQGRDYEGLHLMNDTIAGGRHTGVKAEAYTRGLQWVFKDIAPTGPSGLEVLMRDSP